MRIGIIYRVDYIGNHPLIKGCSYAGSKRESQMHNWSRYFGSPSTKNCLRCEAWRCESKVNPHLFIKTIIREVMIGESIIKCEIEYLKSVSDDIIRDVKWLNNSIPRVGAFPEFFFTAAQMKERERKRKQTTLEKIGFECNFQNQEKIKENVLKKYGVEYVSQLPERRLRNSIHKKQYFANMSEEDRRLHGLRSLKGRDPVNVRAGIKSRQITRSNWSDEYKQQIEKKRREKWQHSIDNHTLEKRQQISDICKYASTRLRKQYYITIEFIETQKIESKFLNEWLAMGFARDGIMYRIKSGSSEPLFSRTLKQWIRVLSHEKRRLAS